jgi:hypothetical protein
MPVSLGMGIQVPASASYYRITSLALRTASAKHHPKVVNGDGAVHSRHGARYNYPGARTVYLTEDPLTCFAEKLFYFQREVLTGLDSLHLAPVSMMPRFHQRFILWEVIFKSAIANVFDLSVAKAPSAGVYPCLLLNPSQDYRHLKDRRAAIQSAGYDGLRAPSTRVLGSGNMIVLFDDQSKNVKTITPYEVEFRLIQPGHPPAIGFASHATDKLDHVAGEVRVLSPSTPGALPAALGPYSSWTIVRFNH